ncbi:MAG: ribosome maturation factor [Ferruginibacter sp.]|nr:ribosome maturation factor [Ferruginibacter sp.]
MSTEKNIELVKQILLSKLYDDIFLVEMKVKPINNFKIYLDADSGLGIEKCIKINRALYKQLEEMGMYPEGDFSLEVSSPGIDEPLKMIRQYVKNIGRFVEITLNDDTIKEGKLLDATEIEITIEYTEGKGKKALTTKLIIPFLDIKQTIVQIKF